MCPHGLMCPKNNRTYETLNYYTRKNIPQISFMIITFLTCHEYKLQSNYFFNADKNEPNHSKLKKKYSPG
jgi:hypothetical protein